MKRTLFFFILSVGFLGCSKSNKELSDLTQEVISQKSVASMKQSYGFLSSNEKTILWQTKLLAILNNDSQRLTERQREIVAEIKSLLDKYTMDMLIKNSSIGETFLNKHLVDYEKNFTTQQLYLLIENPYYTSDFSIFQADTYLDVLSSSEEEAFDDIGAGGGAGNCTCYYNIGCGLNGYCNWKAGCTPVANCGLFGTSNCKGKCD